MRYFNERIETMPRPELEQLQLERLQSTLNRVYRNVQFYQDVFDQIGFSADAVSSLDDLRNLPFTRKEHLQQAYPYGMLAEPLRETVRIQFSSGTRGRPTVIAYTINDVKQWTELMARILVQAGVTREDIVQISFDYGMFTGGFGYHYGAECIGATVIPASDVAVERQIEIMRDFRTSVMVGLPSYAVEVADTVRAARLPKGALHLRVGLFGGEAWTEQTRAALESGLGIVAVDNYGLSEFWGPGVSGECSERAGLHIWEDCFYPEVVDPRTGEPLPDGQEGELVLTSLVQEAVPVLRYRTGDLTSITREPCRCGRTHARMARVRARTDDLVVFRGVKFLPVDVERVLATEESVRSSFTITKEGSGAHETLVIAVSVREEMFSDEVRKLEELRRRLCARLEKALGVAVEVRLVEPRP